MTAVLIVEDDPFIALDLATLLRQAGFHVLGPAVRNSEALALLARHHCDVGLLDVNLGSETSEVVAQELLRREIPFIALSGFARDDHPAVFKGMPALLKPVRFEVLLNEIKQLCERQSKP